MEEKGEKVTKRFLEEGDFVVIGSVRLTVRDTECLRARQWLVDNVIEFYLEYLRLREFGSHKDLVTVVSPSVAQFIKICAHVEDLVGQVLSLKLDKKWLVVIPVNDADVDRQGTHWSLMLFVPCNQHFLHIDTREKTNYHSALTVCRKIADCLQLEDATFQHFQETKQSNNYDCGLYVLQNARAAFRYILEGGLCKPEFRPITEEPNLDLMRKHVMDVICVLTREQHKTFQISRVEE